MLAHEIKHPPQKALATIGDSICPFVNRNCQSISAMHRCRCDIDKLLCSFDLSSSMEYISV
jgi:hypothetical protein